MLFLLFGLISASLSFSSCLSSNSVSFHVPSDASYTSLYNSNVHNLAFSGSKGPTYLTLPSTESQAQAVISCFQNASLSMGGQLLIRGGGHSYEGYSYSSFLDYVLLDLQHMQTIYLDAKLNQVTVQGGATLGQLYTFISSKSPNENQVYGFPAGTCPSVGVGGHFLGGGVGLLIRKHGLALDHILSMRVVTYNGSLLTVSASSYPDLFWGLRGGGGGNFALVTSYTLQLIVLEKQIIQFSVDVPFDLVPQGIFEWQSFLSNADVDLSYMTLYWDGSSASFSGLYLGSDLTHLQTLLSKGVPTFYSTMTSDSFDSKIYNASQLMDPPERVAFKAKSDIISSPLSLKALRTLSKSLANTRAYVLFDAYGGIMNDIGIDSTAFPYRNGTLFDIQYLIEWDPSTSGASEKKLIKGIYGGLRPYLQSQSYINYIDSDLGTYPNVKNVSGQDVWNVNYFGVHLDRLKRVKADWDPTSFFKFPQSIQ